jgi:diguanylate cyclase (GGDEF)-like protein
MEWQSLLYLTLLIISAIASLTVGWQAWQRRKAPGSLPLAFFMAAVIEWTVALACEYVSDPLPAKIVFAKIEYLGAVASPVLLFWFALEFYTQKKLSLRPWHLAFWIVPVLTLALVSTNEVHHLIWTQIRIRPEFSATQPVYDHGPMFWVYVAYDYLVLFSASILIIRSFIKSRYIYRRQALAMVIALPFPWLGNVLYVFHIAGQGQDFTSVGLGITGVILNWAMRRLQLFDLVPVARDLVIEWMDDVLIIFNQKQQLVDLNHAAERLLTRLLESTSPAGAPDWIGQTPAELKTVFPQLAALFQREADGKFELSVQMDGQAVDFEARISTLTKEITLRRREREVLGRMMVLRDITDLKKAREAAFLARDQALAAADENARLYEQLKQMAITDSLTGIYIRRHFFDLAKMALNQAAASRQPVSALMLDLDRFKKINDTYGHSTGDKFLQIVSKICADSLRKNDIIGRYGGEEFVALLPETGLNEAVMVANRLCARISATALDTSSGQVSITVSIGVSTLLSAEASAVADTAGPAAVDAVELLIDRADRALYLAKQAGRNQVKEWVER